MDKKGYVRLRTNLGDLNLELHCDSVPRTCENFLTLCGVGYYDGVAFHRSIKNFMIQGGDPTGTGKRVRGSGRGCGWLLVRLSLLKCRAGPRRGGESIYGKTFKDEINTGLKHAGRGVLSMANSGPHTNGSQFFITYKSAPHLDGKHSIFGRVVGGLETLAAMERVPTGTGAGHARVRPQTGHVPRAERVGPCRPPQMRRTGRFRRSRSFRRRSSPTPSLSRRSRRWRPKRRRQRRRHCALRTRSGGRGSRRGDRPAAWGGRGPAQVRGRAGRDWRLPLQGGIAALCSPALAAGEPSASKVGAAALEAARQAQVGEARPAKKPKTQYGDFSGW